MKAIALLAVGVLGSVCSAQHERFPDTRENLWVYVTLLNLKQRGFLGDYPTSFLRATPSRIEIAGATRNYIEKMDGELLRLEERLARREGDLDELFVEAEGFASTYPDVYALKRIVDAFAVEFELLNLQTVDLQKRLDNLIHRSQLLHRATDLARSSDGAKIHTDRLRSYLTSSNGLLRAGAVVLLTRDLLNEPMPHQGARLNSQTSLALMGMRETELSVLFNACRDVWRSETLTAENQRSASSYEQLHRVLRVLEKVDGVVSFYPEVYIVQGSSALSRLAVYALALAGRRTEFLYGLAFTGCPLGRVAWDALSRYRPRCNLVSFACLN